MYDLSNIEMVIINNLKETDPIKEFYRNAIKQYLALHRYATETGRF